MKSKECTGILCGSRGVLEKALGIMKMNQAGELLIRKAKFLGKRKFKLFRMKWNARTVWEKAVRIVHAVRMNGGPLFRGKLE